MNFLFLTIVQISLVCCIALPLSSDDPSASQKEEKPADEINALRAKDTHYDDSDDNIHIITHEKKSQIIKVPVGSRRGASQDNGSSAEVLQKKGIKGKSYEQRVDNILSRLLPRGEIELLKYANQLLYSLIGQFKEFCERVERGKIQSSPFFDCSVFDKSEPSDDEDNAPDDDVK